MVSPQLLAMVAAAVAYLGHGNVYQVHPIDAGMGRNALCEGVRATQATVVPRKARQAYSMGTWT